MFSIHGSSHQISNVTLPSFLHYCVYQLHLGNNSLWLEATVSVAEDLFWSSIKSLAPKPLEGGSDKTTRVWAGGGAHRQQWGPSHCWTTPWPCQILTTREILIREKEPLCRPDILTHRDEHAGRPAGTMWGGVGSWEALRLPSDCRIWT